MASDTSSAPSLFLRNATGLVKGWSGFDAFAYSFMSVNLVTLGMFYSLAIFAYKPDGSAIASIIVTAIGMTFMVIAYAGLIAVMPRAGGDYVWQTRVLDGIPGAVTGGAFGAIALFLVGTALALGDVVTYGGAVVGALVGATIGLKRGGVGFVLSATGWWFILALWAPIYGFILKIEFVQPLSAILGWKAGVDFFGTADGTFAVAIATIVITSALVALGMAGYARIQRWCLYIGLIALAVMFLLMLVTTVDTFKPAYDKAVQGMFGVPNAYQATIDLAASDPASAYTGSDLEPFSFGPGTLALVPFMLFFLLYPNWGATLYGEVRGAGDFKKVLRGMIGGLWVTVALAVIFLLLASRAFGWTFFNASNVTYVNYAYAYTTAAPPMPIWGYPPMLAAFVIDSNLIQAIIVLAFGAWWLGWTGTLFLSSTRMIFAAAFDRMLPEWAGRVSDTRAVPWAALALIMIPSVFLSWLYAYNSTFYGLTLDATLVIAVTFFGTSIAAMILPWWKKELYETSPMARYKLAGLPVLGIAGAVSTIFLGWVLFMWLSNSLYGIGVGNKNSIVFLGFLYGAAALLYIVARAARRSQGIDLDAIHSEIPAE
ncbi:MAG: basic amino acid/polyamine antiporter, family [Chloroflexota bacterium]|jgi:amino acid transporter|nr:basic amino acid/polyamine antiporter, family [Chloroflexota bacterium]